MTRKQLAALEERYTANVCSTQNPMTIRQRQGIRRYTSSQQTGESGLGWTLLVLISIAIGVGLYYAF